jgi:hypothetical protein
MASSLLRKILVEQPALSAGGPSTIRKNTVLIKELKNSDHTPAESRG